MFSRERRETFPGWAIPHGESPLWAEHRDPPVKDQGLPQCPVCCWEVLRISVCSVHGVLHSLTR